MQDFMILLCSKKNCSPVGMLGLDFQNWELRSCHEDGVGLLTSGLTMAGRPPSWNHFTSSPSASVSSLKYGDRVVMGINWEPTHHMLSKRHAVPRRSSVTPLSLVQNLPTQPSHF